MSNSFFDRPILNFPYECPRQHWERNDSVRLMPQIIRGYREKAAITRAQRQAQSIKLS